MCTGQENVKAPLFSLVVTVLNEEKNLSGLCRELYEISHELPPYEIIIVDDGSSDGTVRVLKDIRKKILPHMRIISHDHNCGKSCALKTAIDHAYGRWIATLDGDGQDRPQDVLSLVKKACVAHDEKQIFVGVRKKRRDGFFRICATRIANKIRRFCLHDGCPDTGAPIKVFPRNTYQQLPFFEGQHRFLPALFQAYGCDLHCMEVVHRKREYGVSHYTNLQRAIDGFIDLLGVFWLIKRTHLPSKIKEWK